MNVDVVKTIISVDSGVPEELLNPIKTATGAWEVTIGRAVIFYIIDPETGKILNVVVD